MAAEILTQCIKAKNCSVFVMFCLYICTYMVYVGSYMRVHAVCMCMIYRNRDEEEQEHNLGSPVRSAVSGIQIPSLYCQLQSVGDKYCSPSIVAIQDRHGTNETLHLQQFVIMIQV